MEQVYRIHKNGFNKIETFYQHFKNNEEVLLIYQESTALKENLYKRRLYHVKNRRNK